MGGWVVVVGEERSLESSPPLVSSSPREKLGRSKEKERDSLSGSDFPFLGSQPPAVMLVQPARDSPTLPPDVLYTDLEPAKSQRTNARYLRPESRRCDLHESRKRETEIHRSPGRAPEFESG